MTGGVGWPPVAVGDEVELPTGTHYLGRRTVRLRLTGVPTRAELLADSWVWGTAAQVYPGGAIGVPLPVLVRVEALRPAADR